MTETATVPFGPLLRRLRLVAGLSQEELAERSGLSGRGISALETGHRATPRPETVRLLADALRLDGAARAELVAAARPELAARAGARPASGGPPLALPVPVPVPPTRLVGREQEVSAICARLGAERTRLVTLSGPGGVGKSRLALAAAAELADGFADGVGWVDLAPLADPVLLPSTVARALGVRESVDQPLHERLQTALRPRELLLLLDNCEHLVTAVAALVGDLLAACPRLTVLATSRERLRLRGEQELAVSPLAVPAPVAGNGLASSVAGLAGVAAVRLFVERAADVEPGFALSADNATAVAAVCTRLDGLPLAIELAAARVKVLPPSALLARLEPRLPLLTAGARDLPARQRTMYDAIAWSYDLLSPEEQTLFRRLAVFAGGFTLAAAEVVAGGAPGAGIAPLDVLHGVGALADKSLLRREGAPDGRAGEPRFRMLETVREYGLERLRAHDGEAETRARHAAWCSALAEQVDTALSAGCDRARHLDLLAAEIDNVRAAAAWLIGAGDAVAAVGLVGGVGSFWYVRGHLGEGRSLLEQALALPGDVPPGARARALAVLAMASAFQHDFPRAEAAANEAASVAAGPDRRGLALARLAQTIVALNTGAIDAAVAWGEASIALYRALGAEGDLDTAYLCTALGLRSLREFDRAEALLGEGLRSAERRGDDYGVAVAHEGLGTVARDQGDNARALPHFVAGLAAHHRAGELWHAAWCLEGAALAGAEAGPAWAARLLGAAESLRTAIGAPTPTPHRPAHDRVTAHIRACLGDERFAEAWDQGARMTLADAVAETEAVAARSAADPATSVPPSRRR